MEYRSLRNFRALFDTTVSPSPAANVPRANGSILADELIVRHSTSSPGPDASVTRCPERNATSIALFDMPTHELELYAPDVSEPDDLDGP